LLLLVFFLPQRRYVAKVCFYFFLLLAKILFFFSQRRKVAKVCFYLFSFYRKDAKSLRFAFTFARKDATSQRLDFISFLFTAKTLRRKGLTLFLFFLPQRRYAAKV
jgi:hypothetical protein